MLASDRSILSDNGILRDYSQMIFLENAGGLGNQLFIWMAAHQLSTDQCERVVILTPRKSDRKNELGELIKVCSHDIQVVETNLYFKMARFLQKIERKLFPGDALSRILGIVTLHDPTARIDSINVKPKIVRGYFQYSDLVMSNSKEILSELKLIIDKKFNSVSLRMDIPASFQLFHIRRGDYLQNRETLGVLSDTYFNRQRDEKYPLVICTENQDDLTDNLGSILIVDKNSASPWEALALMARSSKLVTSNSTLSWWGGVLAIIDNDMAEVTCPEPWTKSTISQKDYLRVESFKYRRADFL